MTEDREEIDTSFVGDMGVALAWLRGGRRVARAGWNEKGMFLYLVPEGAYPARTDAAKAHWGPDALVPYGPYVAMKTAQDNVVPWLASQTDLLAADWCVLPELEHHPERGDVHGRVKHETATG